MTLVVGIDIGNSTTEACTAVLHDAGDVEILGTALCATSGVKGTLENVDGVERAFHRAVEAAGCRPADVDLVLINEATPVISGVAMETITQTVVTESTMIGHNPRTPAGTGLGVGITVDVTELETHVVDGPVVALVSADVDFEDAAHAITSTGCRVVAAVIARDDANLVVNRLKTPIPVVDEVTRLDLVPRGMQAAVEVAPPGRTVRRLSDTYGIAAIFGLDASQTRSVSAVARALAGTRSAVVVRTPAGEVAERVIPAGRLRVVGQHRDAHIDVDEGAAAIMATVRRLAPLTDVHGDPGTNAGGMLARVRSTMATLNGLKDDDVRIRDVLALDTVVPQPVVGGIAGEIVDENAVALAAMVRTERGPMEVVAQRLATLLGVPVTVGGVEADMSVRGALTTPGSARPVAVLDIGGGSTDAAFAAESGFVSTVHVAGAGDLVTRLVDSELGFDDVEIAECVKRHPLAKADSFFHLRLEDGTVEFLDDPLPPEAYARVVCLTDDGVVPIRTDHSVERIRQVRRSAKQRVFVANAVRALEQIAPDGNLRLVDFVIIVGGSALDFEIPELISAELAPFGIVCGTGNIRGTEGPRNAVATGLVLAHAAQRPHS